MSETLNFRKATIEDLDLIVALLANDPLGAGRELKADRQVYLSAFEKIDNDPNQELIVAESEAGIMGTFQLSYLQYLTYSGGMRAQVEAVRVHPDHRGKGIGKQLFEWAIQRAKAKGAHLLQLTTDKKRPEAFSFYEGLGFVSSHEGMKLHF